MTRITNGMNNLARTPAGKTFPLRFKYEQFRAPAEVPKPPF